MSDQDAYRREQARQTQLLTEAIDKAITDASAAFAMPMLNAVAGALVAVQGHVLASAPRKHRKELQKAMERQLPKANAAAKGRVATAQTATMGRTQREKLN